MPKKPTFKKIIESLLAKYQELGYADAGFNIHDCSDSMHEADSLSDSIDTLEHIIDDQLDEALLAQCETAYINAYAKYANDHDVFDDDELCADTLTQVSSGTYVDFKDPQVWAQFLEKYNELKKAAA